MFFRHEFRKSDPGNRVGIIRAPDMKTILLILLMSTIVMIAYFAVPARPAAEPKTQP
jgi:hypothetical protein